MAVTVELTIEQLAAALRRLGPSEIADLETLIDDPDPETADS